MLIFNSKCDRIDKIPHFKMKLHAKRANKNTRTEKIPIHELIQCNDASIENLLFNLIVWCTTAIQMKHHDWSPKW